ncbi:uncharacterized protein TRAVEDRAFT_48063 [Trametes versicolor FP-101664 SS1]|uniref:uncharacterized protein n=1 Tax=Trametes versicolor (strain FP-101664) TaxID=717944 RepID=UPI000462340A|nr:uncharacterized protein TRAVEDRAFT_48063 [Trametes versicolor FP-101664 SS1]EIW58920.1 hypothetical protein TRAVEDRAFT_48063 [Trametes versicolor FP-101664 SS1]
MAHNPFGGEERWVVHNAMTPRYTLAEVMDMLVRLAEEERRRPTSSGPSHPIDPNGQRGESHGSSGADNSSVNNPGDRRYWDNVSPDSSFLNAYLPSILPEPALIPSRLREARVSENVEEGTGGSTDSNSGTYHSSHASSADEADPPVSHAPSSDFVPSSNLYRSVCPTSALRSSPRLPGPGSPVPATSSYATFHGDTPPPAALSASGHSFAFRGRLPSPPSASANYNQSTSTDVKGKARMSSSIPLRPSRLSLSTTAARPETTAASSVPWVFIGSARSEPGSPPTVSRLSANTPSLPANAPALSANAPTAASVVAPPEGGAAEAEEPEAYTPIFAEDGDGSDWYAVVRGRRVGVFANNLTAVASVNGISGFAMKQYKTRAEAMRAFREAEQFGLVCQVGPQKQVPPVFHRPGSS